MEHTYKALEKAIAICKPDVMYKEIGNVIEKYAKEHGYKNYLNSSHKDI